MTRPVFQQRHYEKVAEALLRLAKTERLAAARELCRQFERDNPAFNIIRFFEACHLVTDESRPKRRGGQFAEASH